MWKRGHKSQTSHPHVSRRVPSVEALIRVRHHSTYGNCSKTTKNQYCSVSDCIGRSTSSARNTSTAHFSCPLLRELKWGACVPPECA